MRFIINGLTIIYNHAIIAESMNTITLRKKPHVNNVYDAYPSANARCQFIKPGMKV